ASRWLVTRRPLRVRKSRNFSRAAGKLTGKQFGAVRRLSIRSSAGNHPLVGSGLPCGGHPAVIRAMIVGVHPLAGFDKLLHYRVPENLRATLGVGSLVRVPVRRTLQLGIVGEIG